MEDVQIGPLIGLNCPSILRPREITHGEENAPYAVRSVICWYVNGPASNEERKANMQRNRIQLTAPSSGYIVAERSIKECPCVAPQLVQRMFELDVSENEVGVALSRDDQKFLKIAEDGIRHCENSQYEMPLPFKHENIQLPNNRSQAKQRLNSLKKFQTESTTVVIK